MVAGGDGARGGGAVLAHRAGRDWLGALAAYASAATLFALDAARRDDITLAPLVAACFPALHGGYGVGTLRRHRPHFAADARFRPLTPPILPFSMTEPASRSISMWCSGRCAGAGA